MYFLVVVHISTLNGVFGTNILKHKESFQTLTRMIHITDICETY